MQGHTIKPAIAGLCTVALALALGGAALALGGAALASDDETHDLDRSRYEHRGGEYGSDAPAGLLDDAPADALSIAEIVARLDAAGYRDIHEIEREHGRYEVEGRDAGGNPVELVVDARTGEVLRSKRDD